MIDEDLVRLLVSIRSSIEKQFESNPENLSFYLSNRRSIDKAILSYFDGAIKSRYNGLGQSNYADDDNNKSKASINISSIKSGLRADDEINKTNNNTKNNMNMSKSISQFSNNRNGKDNGSFSNTNNRSSQNDVSSKIKSIENTYFMNK